MSMSLCTKEMAGVALIVAGAFVLYDGRALTRGDEALELGGLTIPAAQRHLIAPWFIAAALMGGFALLVDAKRRFPYERVSLIRGTS